MPGLFSAMQMLKTLDVVASLPICTAKVCQDWGDFTIHKLPFELAKVPFYMVWHERFDGDAGHVWLWTISATSAASFDIKVLTKTPGPFLVPGASMSSVSN